MTKRNQHEYEAVSVPHNRGLHDAMYRFAINGHAVLASLLPKKCPTDIPRQVYLRIFAAENSELLKALPTYAALVSALQQDVEVSKHFGRLVGSPLSQTRFPDASEFPVVVLASTFGEDPQSFDVVGFEQLYRAFEEFVYDDTTVLTSVVSLHNFTAESAALEVASGLTIIKQQPTDDSLPMMGPFGTMIQVYETWVARSGWQIVQRIEVPKVVRDPREPATHLESYANPLEESNRDLADIILALRLLKPGRVVPLLRRITESGGFGLGGILHTGLGSSPQLFPIGGPQYHLANEDVERLCTLWTILDEARNRDGSLEIAVARFGYTYDRSRSDDRLVDLMIAFEALLLTERDELSLKLALMAAVLLGKTNSERREVFQLFRDAYKLRSCVVHGKKVDMNKLSKVILSLEDRLRQCLTQLFEEGTTSHGRLGSWRKRLLQEALFQND